MFQSLKRPKIFYKNFARLAAPVVLQNLITLSLAMCDTLFLGAVGENEIAAVTLANSPFFVIMLMVFGFHRGSSVLISQYWGKRDTKTISRVIGVAFMAAITLTTLCAAVTMLFPHQIMRFFTPDPILLDMAARYMKIVAVSYVINTFTQVYISAHRSMENAAVGMYIFGAATLTNTVLNYILIFGKFGAPALGIEGAAIATVISRVVELGITIAYAASNRRFRLDLGAMFRPGRAIAADFFRYGAPVVLNETLWGLGVSLYPAILSRMGTDILAAQTISTNVEKVFNVLATGVANASGVIIGTLMGQGKAKEAFETSHTLRTLSFLVGVAAMLFLLVAAWPIVSWFNIPDTTKAVARVVLIIYALRLPMVNINMTTVVGILRAGGDSRVAAMIDLVALWLFSLPVSALLGLVFKTHYIYVFIAICMDDVIKCCLSVARLKSGVWMRNVTRDFS